MQKITPFLWFDGNAEEAMNFYVSIFENSKVLSVTRYGDPGAGPKGTVMTAKFQLEGQEFIALNGGSQFKFTEAIIVSCELRNAERSGRVLGETLRWRREIAMRLA
jgi:predicted 3-demethylubiquinone-9 3-methyltransferase (glyoxalase superfamily)